MKLPEPVLEQFRKHGSAGGRERARRLAAPERKAIARRAAFRRWTRERFGATSFQALGVPGGALGDAGLADVGYGAETPESPLVSLAGPGLLRAGVSEV